MITIKAGNKIGFVHPDIDEKLQKLAELTGQDYVEFINEMLQVVAEANESFLGLAPKDL